MKALYAVIVTISAMGILAIASLASASYFGAEASAAGDGVSAADDNLINMHQWKHMFMLFGDLNESGPHEYSYYYTYNYNFTALSDCDCDCCDKIYSYGYNYDSSYDKQE